MTDTTINGDIYVINDPEGHFVVKDSNGQDTIDAAMVYQQLREDFGDHYDFITIIVDTLSGLPNIGHGSTPIYNNIQGIGMELFDARAPFGTNKLIRTSLHRLAYDISPDLNIYSLMHEIGHTWCFYVGNTAPADSPLRLLHEDFPIHPESKWGHWGRWPDNANSCMDYDLAEWIDLGNGEFNRKVHDQDWENEWFGFCPLDLYLMGLIPTSEVPKITIVQYPEPAISNSFSGPYKPTPGSVQIDIADILTLHGNRNPSYMDSQRVFHDAWIFITKDDKQQGFFDQLNNWQKFYTKRFRIATGGRAMVDASLLRAKIFSQEDYREIFFRDAEAGGDIYNKNSGYFWNSPDLWVRNSDEGDTPVTEHQPPIPGQSNWIYASLNNFGGAPYKNVTVNIYLANWDNKFYPSTEFLYPVDWNPNGLIGSVTNIQATPALLGPAGKTIVKVEWKADKISEAVACSHPCLLAEIIPMEVEPSKLHHVFENRKLAQRNLTIIDPDNKPPEGSQSIGPQPFMFSYEFMIGNRMRAAGTTELQIKAVQSSEHLHLFLDPAGLVEGLSEEAEEIEADIPLAPGMVPSSSSGIIAIASSSGLNAALIGQSGDSSGRLSGITLGIPAKTEVGILPSPEEKLGPKTLRIRFCEDTRIELGYRTQDSRLTKKYELKGLKPVILNGVPLLRISDPTNASMKLKLKPGQTPILRLIGIVSSRKNLGNKSIYDITESLDSKKVIGGLRLQVNL